MAEGTMTRKATVTEPQQQPKQQPLKPTSDRTPAVGSREVVAVAQVELHTHIHTHTHTETHTHIVTHTQKGAEEGEEEQQEEEGAVEEADQEEIAADG